MAYQGQGADSLSPNISYASKVYDLQQRILLWEVVAHITQSDRQCHYAANNRADIFDCVDHREMQLEGHGIWLQGSPRYCSSLGPDEQANDYTRIAPMLIGQ